MSNRENPESYKWGGGTQVHEDGIFVGKNYNYVYSYVLVKGNDSSHRVDPVPA